MSKDEFIESKETFINYLNNEIDQIREDIKMPGWTSWAVLAALGSIGWFIVLETEKNVFNLEQVFLLFLILTLAYSTLRDVYDFFKPNQSIKKTRYFTVDILFREKRLAFVVSIFQACLMVLLILHFSTQAGAVSYYLLLFHYGVIIFSPIIVLLLEKSLKKITNTHFYIPDSLEFSIPANPPRTKRLYSIMNGASNIPFIFMFIVVSYSLVVYSLFYISLYGTTIDSATFSSLKISLLVFSIFLLLKLWVYSEQRSPTLKELVEIRRDLMFGNINVEMARKLAEISISGLNKSAVIQREITNCIATLQGIDTELNKAAQKNRIASNQLQDNSSAENVEAQRILWETIRDATLVHLRQARTIYLSDKSLRGGLARFLAIYGPMQPEDKGFVESLRNMGELYDEVKRKYDETVFDWLSLVVKFEGEPASSKWRSIAINELKAELPEPK